MSRHINTAISEIVDDFIASSLDAESIGELWWDAGHVLVPSPNGQPLVQGLFSVMCPNPILGHPPLVTSAMLPSIAALADKSIAERVIAQALGAMVDQRAGILAQQSSELVIPGMPKKMKQLDMSGFQSGR